MGHDEFKLFRALPNPAFRRDLQHDQRRKRGLLSPQGYAQVESAASHHRQQRQFPHVGRAGCQALTSSKNRQLRETLRCSVPRPVLLSSHRPDGARSSPGALDSAGSSRSASLCVIRVFTRNEIIRLKNSSAAFIVHANLLGSSEDDRSAAILSRLRHSRSGRDGSKGLETHNVAPYFARIVFVGLRISFDTCKEQC